jgi:hypothetical protein
MYVKKITQRTHRKWSGVDLERGEILDRGKRA